VEPEISFIIVNWNGGELLRRCFRCLVESLPSVPYEIILVDNASSDESLTWLRSPEVRNLLGETPFRIIENEQNLGFAIANNQALKESKAPFVFLLNSDADLTPGAVDTLLATIKTDSRIGAVGPRLLNSDGTLQHSVWRNPPTAWEILLNGTGAWRLIPRGLRGRLLLGGHWEHNRKRDVPMLFGAAILARREMVEKVGGFDERFHMYSEDAEWSLRIRRNGWRIVFEPAARVVHHGGQSALQRWTSSEKRRIQLETFFQFQQYSLPRYQVIANELAMYFVAWGQRAWRFVRRRPTDDFEMFLAVHRENLRRLIRENATTSLRS
jgi:GT2 family glycosyltransferase